MDRRKTLRESPEKPAAPEQSTAELLDGVARLQIQRSPGRALPPSQWDSTTSYLNADFANLDNRRDPVPNISESTVFFDGHQNPISPVRRSLSGSSMDMLTKETQEEGDPLLVTRRTASAPEQGSHSVDMVLLLELLSGLPTTQRYLHFKGVLSHYMEILQEHGLDPSTDKFVITIYNQLRSFGGHSRLDRIVDIFVSEPCNEAMKLSNFLHFQEFKQQSNFFKLWVIKRRKYSEIQKSEMIWKLYTEKKFMSKISFKYGVYTEDFEDNAIMFQRVKSLMKFWDIWMGNYEERYTLLQMADLRVQSKFFTNWKCRVQDSSIDADSLYETAILKRAFRDWRLRTLCHSSRLTKRTFLTVWRREKTFTETMHQDSIDLEFAFHAGFFFSKWKQRYERIKDKTTKLDVIYKKHVQRKIVTQWKSSLRYKLVENEARQRRNLFLKGFVIRQFSKRYLSQQRATAFARGQDYYLLRNALHQWQTQKLLREFERGSKGRIMRLWKRKIDIIQRAKDYDKLLLRKSWEEWNVQIMKRQNSLELSTSAFKSYTKVIYFNNWRVEVGNSRKRHATADRQFATRFFRKWRSRKGDMYMKQERAVTFHERNKYLIKRFFSLLVAKYDESCEERMELMIPGFDERTNWLKKQASFKTWYRRYREPFEQEERFKQDVLKDKYMKPILERWSERTRLVAEMSQHADELNNLNLISSGFAKLSLRYFQTRELESMLIEQQEDVELRCILKYLNLWTLRLMKVRRDTEIIQRFQSRWDRAHLRALLLLWQGKSMDKKRLEEDEHENEEFETNDDVSMDVFDTIKIDSYEEDDSPTKHKSSMRASPFLQTPQKALDTTGLSFTKESIPGSERIKRRRYEALKSHYSQIKYAIPSPLKAIPDVKGSRAPSTGSSKKLDFGDLNIFRTSRHDQHT